MRRALALIAGVLLPAIVTTGPAWGAGQSLDQAQARLKQDGSGVQVVRDGRGSAGFIRASGISAADVGASSAAAPRAVADAALRRYRGAFGLTTPRTELRYASTTGDALGAEHVRYQRLVSGVPLWNGRVTVHLAGGSRLRAASAAGGAVDALNATQAAVSRATAEATARRAVGANARAFAPTRLVAFAGPLADRPQSRLAYAVDLISPDGGTHAITMVDARTGKVLDSLDRTMEARSRRTYTANNLTFLPGTLVLTEGSSPSGDTDVDNAHAFAGEVYDYYSSTFGRDSYDGNGATLISTAHYSVGYENAFWDGSQMVYGDGFTADDVVGHELTHAVTERTAGLEYQDQPGALNESLSDMAGWDVDPGDSTMGEDLPIGAIRDMENPGAYGQPATASQYVCTSSDNGGVHTNSGIPNKVYANLVDTLGRGAAEQIRYRAQTTYLGPTSSFADARAAFVQAASDVGSDAGATGAAWDAQGVTASWQPGC